MNATRILTLVTNRNDKSVSVTIPATGFKTWLEQQATTHQLRYMLAHALDGVIWGEMRQGKLQVAQSDYTPSLLEDTLQEVRVFGNSAEIHIWRTGKSWQGRLIRPVSADETPTYTESINEQRMLWGDQVESRHNGFSIMTDGIQGLCHAVPLDVPHPTPEQAVKDRNGKPTKQYKVRPLRLVVRHYLAPDDVAHIVTSRLVSLKNNGQEFTNGTA